MLRHALEDEKYPNWFIQKIFNRFKFNKIEEQEKSKNYKEIVTLPYLPDILKILNRIKQNIRVYTNPLQTTKQILLNLKDSIESKQQPEVIDEILCLHCDGIYISETGRKFCTRCKKHMRDVNPKI